MRSRMLRVRLSESEWAKLEALAGEARRSMSDYVRLQVLVDGGGSVPGSNPGTSMIRQWDRNPAGDSSSSEAERPAPSTSTVELPPTKVADLAPIIARERTAASRRDFKPDFKQ